MIHNVLETVIDKATNSFEERKLKEQITKAAINTKERKAKTILNWEKMPGFPACQKSVSRNTASSSPELSSIRRAAGSHDELHGFFALKKNWEGEEDEEEVTGETASPGRGARNGGVGEEMAGGRRRWWHWHPPHPSSCPGDELLLTQKAPRKRVC